MHTVHAGENMRPDVSVAEEPGGVHGPRRLQDVFDREGNPTEDII